MNRLNAIRVAERPKMHGRAMLSGPSGAGKTWTALSIASVLADGDMSRVLVIDTERESALTYADVFVGFQHLPWRPPYDPTELTDTLGQLGDSYVAVVVDSFTHFWRGQGGTLDIADGKFGGWKSARPVQEALVEALLGVPAHVLLCVRSKTEYLVEHNGNKVTKLGVAPMQDDSLVFEMNVAFDIDLEHRITVTKSRTPAVPVGRMYPAGLEKKAAEDYKQWLAGGVPPAGREDVERIVARFGEMADAEERKQVKAEFVERFGMPHSLTAAQVAEAGAWLDRRLGRNDHATQPDAADDGGRPEPEAPSTADKDDDLATALDERIAALPEDLANDVRSRQTQALQEGTVTPHSAAHRKLIEDELAKAEKAQKKRTLDALGACKAAGFESDDDRHAFLGAVTAGTVTSAKRLTATQVKELTKVAVRIGRGELGVVVREDGSWELREAVSA